VSGDMSCTVAWDVVCPVKCRVCLYSFFNIMSDMCTSIIMPNVSGCHRYLRFFDAPPEDGNLIAETCVGVTNIHYFVNNSCALIVLT
jgi:hypothetical protein